MESSIAVPRSQEEDAPLRPWFHDLRMSYQVRVNTYDKSEVRQEAPGQEAGGKEEGIKEKIYYN